MKKNYFLVLVLVFLSLVSNARERVWFIGKLGIDLSAPVDHRSPNELPGPVYYNTYKQTALDEESWTGTLCTTTCTDALEICKNFFMYAHSGSAYTPDQYYNLTGRLQLYSSAPVTPPTLPTIDYVAINVLGDATVSIYCNPSNPFARNINLVNAAGIVQATAVTSAVRATASGGVAEKITLNYAGSATKLYLYLTNVDAYNLYIYAIKVNDTATTGISSPEQVDLGLKKAGNQLLNEAGQEVEIYTVLGAKVLSSVETAIDLSALANGIYIARTAAGSLKFVK